jgi:hypothetical protein
VTTDLNTLLTALCVKIDDWLGRSTRTIERPMFPFDQDIPAPALTPELL